MNEQVRELVAIGASVGAHCEPCLEYHIQTAIGLGVAADDIRQAIEAAHLVEKGAMTAMKKVTTWMLRELSAAATPDPASPRPPAAAAEGKPGGTVLRIYDPAMCCSSGVCGPSVDQKLARFAAALKSISTRPGLRIERYNLGQQPQAFVADAQVKALLGNDGIKKLPFIFINDQLWLQGRYPSKDELLRALNIPVEPIAFPVAAAPATDPCCTDGGCC